MESTPLHKAAEFGRPDVTEVLLRNEANKRLKNKDKETPLMIAKKFGYMDVVAFLEPQRK